MTEEGRQRVASGASRAEQHEARSGVGTARDETEMPGEIQSKKLWITEWD